MVRCLLLALCGVPASTSAAQQLSGTLLREDTGLPSQGTIVMAERVGSGEVVARVVTGARGTWAMRVTTERLVVRALRIGFAPHVLDTVQLSAGERRELNETLPGIAVELPTVRATADARCRVRPDSSTLVARVFLEARTALMASLLATPDGPVRARVRIGFETWSHDESERLDARYREYVTDSLRPFRTTSVDSLYERGFIERRRESVGTRAVEVGVAYRAPGVEFFVDDRFLMDYCLQLAASPSDRPDLIGVEFRPAQTARVTQLQGTLWIDRRTSELQRLEFGYSRLEGREALVQPGGWLEFTRLSSGLLFVSRWALRVPDVGEFLERSRTGGTLLVMPRYVPVLRVSGDVLDLAVDARATYTLGVTDMVEEGALVPRTVPLDSLRAECAPAEGERIVFGTVRRATGAGLAGAEVRIFWRAAEGGVDDWRWSEGRSTDDGRLLVCGLPPDRLLIAEVRAAGYEPASLALRIGSPRPVARLEVVLAAVPER